jgi:hypothetical protein
MSYNRFAGMTFAEASQARREEKAARASINAAKKAKKLAESMTCQCCGRAIFAQSGSIAHHGYERPGYGWQTASCMGAKHLPFEVSRDRLGALIVRLEQRLADLIEAQRQVRDEEVAVTYTATNHNAVPEVVGAPYSTKRIFPTVTFEFTRANFAAILAENTGPYGSGKLWNGYDAICLEEKGFDGIKVADMKRRSDFIAGVHDHLKECQERYDAWKQTFTHFERGTKTWIAK